MKTEHFYINLTTDEQNRVLNSLIKLKNSLIAQGKYTDAVDYYMSLLIVGSKKDFYHPNLLVIDSPRKNLGAQASKNEDDEFKDEKIFNSTIHYLYKIAESMKNDIQLIVVNNG